MNKQVFSNAVLVLTDRTIEGSIVVEDDTIVDVLPFRDLGEGIDCRGEFLAPGIIDIHTDYLERELTPRPDTHFPMDLAFHLMDLRAIGCGVTTVLCAARISADAEGPLGSWSGDGLLVAQEYKRLRETALGRCYIHVRWDPNFEPCSEKLERLQALLPVIGNVVYNESIPGERQYKNTFEQQVRRTATNRGMTFEEAFAWYEERARKARQINNRPEVSQALGGKVPLGSHDDTTEEHVIEAHEAGCVLSEMPVTLEAALKAKELGMQVCMGAPNYYRGGSHCGNLSCHEALEHQAVDILCSDYHFPSLLGSAVLMIESGMEPHEAFRLMTINPAKHLGLDDRLGSIEVGKTADLFTFRPAKHYGLVTSTWVDGQQKFSLPSSANPYVVGERAGIL